MSTAPSSIAVRFGDPVLQAGFTAVPNLILDHYAELAITPAEMLFCIHIWEYWWSKANPYPSLPAIASKMGIQRRQIGRYVGSLKEKGLLIVSDRYAEGEGQLSSEYDFSPLIQAVLNLPPLSDMTRGGVSDLTRAPLSEMTTEEDEYIKTKRGETARRRDHANGSATTEQQQLWQQVLIELSTQMSKQNYATWLRDTRLLSCHNQQITIATSSDFQADWCNSHMKRLIEKQVTIAFGNKHNVVFVKSHDIEQ